MVAGKSVKAAAPAQASPSGGVPSMPHRTLFWPMMPLGLYSVLEVSGKAKDRGMGLFEPTKPRGTDLTELDSFDQKLFTPEACHESEEVAASRQRFLGLVEVPESNASEADVAPEHQILHPRTSDHSTLCHERSEDPCNPNTSPTCRACSLRFREGLLGDPHAQHRFRACASPSGFGGSACDFSVAELRLGRRWFFVGERYGSEKGDRNELHSDVAFKIDLSFQAHRLS